MPVLHTPRRDVRLRLLPVLLAAAALHMVPAAPAAAADEPGWTAEPAAGTAAARPGGARPSFYLEGAPAAVLEDRLALTNTTDQERTVTLRGADAYNTADGAFAVRPAAPAPGAGGAGSWFSFGAGATVKIPPRTRAVVPFTVTVPPVAAPGDHPAAVIAAEAGREAGVRVHLRVSGPTLAALSVEDVAVRGRGAAAVVAYTLVNRGNVALAPEAALRAEGAFGEVPGRGPRPAVVELLPGQRVELTEPWPGAPVLDRVRVTVTVTAPGGAEAAASASAWFVPWRAAGWTGLGLLGLGGTASAALFLVRGRRVRRGPAAGGAAGAEGGPSGTTGATSPAPEHELTGASR
ncbi:COG1470 family protein [Streptomyces erythrochromogenes]|uniref:COG1470 family protein n=1 Tax=Streptomyces erythrochromogenes TaxID=285574 RepID=UPI00367C26ED